MIKVVCDRCGAEMGAKGNIGYVALNYRDGLKGDLERDNPLEDKHYCPICMIKIESFIKSEPETKREEAEAAAEDESVPEAEPVAESESVPEAEAKPKAAAKVRPKAILREKPANILIVTPGGEIEELEVKPKGRRKIDIGKIMSLRDAGWDNKRIGEEMGMTANAVSNAVWSWKRKMAAGAAGNDK